MPAHGAGIFRTRQWPIDVSGLAFFEKFCNWLNNFRSLFIQAEYSPEQACRNADGGPYGIVHEQQLN